MTQSLFDRIIGLLAIHAAKMINTTLTGFLTSAITVGLMFYLRR